MDLVEITIILTVCVNYLSWLWEMVWFMAVRGTCYSVVSFSLSSFVALLSR